TLDGQLPHSGDARRGGNLDMWFWLVPDAATTGVDVGVLTAAPVLQTADQGLPLVVDRSKLRAMVPAAFAMDETVQADPAAARKRADDGGLQDQELQGVIDDRFAGAGDLFTQEFGQIGM